MKKNVWPEWNDQCLNYTYYMFSTNNYKFPPMDFDNEPI